MKKALLFLIPFLAIGLFNKLNAQCTPYNFQSLLKSLSVNGATATATLDVSFDVKANNGSKYIFLHFWTGTDFQNVTINWGGSGQKAPTLTELNGLAGSHQTLMNIVINNSVSPQTYMGTYVDGSTPLFQPSGAPSVTHLSNGADSFVIKNIVINFPSVRLQSLGEIIQGAIWSSNSNSYNTSMSAQCFLNGASFFADPVVAATSMSCNNFNITVTHNSLTQGDVMTGTFDVYADNGDGLYGAGDVKIVPSSPFNITASTLATSYYTGVQLFAGAIPSQYKGIALFGVVTVGQLSLAKFINAPSCSTLPVLFQSFSATRSSQSVSIKWETATEINNRGFYVQRNVNGEWKDIAFVFSKADDGNSNQPLSYSYTDPNPLSSVSYYRVLQVDLDGRGKFSETRIVKGLAEVSKILMFPNPGSNGKINLLFQDEVAPKNIMIYDATGRAVKSFKNVLSANLTVDQLRPGVYNIQVINTTTQVISSDKFIIKD
jgi:hypothetical protein